MEISEKLLLTAIEILETAGFNYQEWTVGGGAILSQKYHHRVSKDIDIFIDDIQKITAISPRFNDISETALDYTEMNNHISLSFSYGRIDFIVAPQITDATPEEIIFKGHKIRIENPIEIIIKKMFYRGNQFVARDIFDLAIVSSSQYRNDLLKEMLNISEKTKIFEQHLLKASTQNFYGMNGNSSILSGGVKFVGKDKDFCLKLFEEFYKILK